MKQHGPWKIVDEREVYSDPWIHVRRDEVIRPDGAPGTHCVVTIKPGVSVLALDNNERVYLTEEFHYAVGRVTIETVSGGIDPGEDALATAQRELAEELGIVAKDWMELGTVDPFTACVLSPTKLFVARELTFGDHAQEGTEQIRCFTTTLDEACDMVVKGEITHAPSCTLILMASRRFQRES